MMQIISFLYVSVFKMIFRMEGQVTKSDLCELNEKLWAEKFVSRDCYPKVRTDIIEPISMTVGCTCEYLYLPCNATTTNFTRRPPRLEFS